MPPSFAILTAHGDEHCDAVSRSHILARSIAASGAGVVVVQLTAGPAARPGFVTASCTAEAVAAVAGYDVVILDQEFDGCAGVGAVIDPLEQVRVPIIVLAPQLRRAPTPEQRHTFERISRTADVLVTGSAAARQRLAHAFDLKHRTIMVISTDALTLGPAAAAVEPPGPTLVTYGLLGPDRGVETIIDAVGALRELEPPPRCLIVGETEPALLAREGEAYRHSLMARTIDRRVAPLVQFASLPLDSRAIDSITASADVLVVANTCHEQLNYRGVRAAQGGEVPIIALVNKATISMAVTAGITRLVPAGNVSALVGSLRLVLSDPKFVASLANGRRGRTPASERIAAQYLSLAGNLLAASRTAASRTEAGRAEASLRNAGDGARPA
jgi:glycosyltransferase involved in cell wall biosynthesis